jgi:hypothetical protein
MRSSEGVFRAVVGDIILYTTLCTTLCPVIAYYKRNVNVPENIEVRRELLFKQH